MKKLLSFILSVALISVMCLYPAITACGAEAPVIVISKQEAAPGGDVSVTITLKNSPGVASVKINISYDSDLILTCITYNPALGGNPQEPETLSNPLILNWISLEPVSGDILFATLDFKVSDECSSTKKPIVITYDAEDICDIDENNIEFNIQSGMIILPHIKGDVNGDGEVNNKDLTRLFQYLSEWNVDVNESALDINGDSDVNNKDLTRLFQYLSEWDVEIF